MKIYSIFLKWRIKTIKKNITAFFLVCITVIALLFIFYHNKRNYTSTFFSMDTAVSLDLSSDLTGQTKKIITDFSEKCDCMNEKSELSLLNQKMDMTVSPELSEAIENTIALNKKFGSEVDISSGKLNLLWKNAINTGILPEKNDIIICQKKSGFENICTENDHITLKNDISIDMGAVAKGYILDVLHDYYENNDIDRAVVSFGSSALLYSTDRNEIFRVAVKSGEDSIAGTVECTSCFVSSSGDYERNAEIEGKQYHHIIDLSTGYPSETGLQAVSVFCSNGIMSDFLSTLIFIDGEKNIEKYLYSDEFEVVAVSKNGIIYHSESLNFKENQ